MRTDVRVLLAPPPQVLVRLPMRLREEANWYAEMGMPISGDVLTAVKQVITTTKVWRGGAK